MNAKNRILSLLEQRGIEGALQSELPRLANLSKSTVSEIISILEEKRTIVRKKVTGNSYRIWLLEYYPHPLKNTLRVGILKASEYPAVVMAAKNVGGIVKVFDNPIELTKSLSVGSVDVAASPLITQLVFACLMKNIYVFRVVAFNGSGIVMMNRRCRKIGTTEMSTMELNLKRISRDWNFVYFKSPERMIACLENGEVDGIAIWEPYLTELSKSYDIMRFDEVVGDFPCCSLAVNSKFLTRESNLFYKFLHAFDFYCKKIDSNLKTRAAAELSKYIKFDSKLIEKSFPSFVFDRKLPNRTILEFVEKETFLRIESVQPFLKL